MYDVIVIGGGPAGVTAALRARELGATVALVERGRLGGTCTNDGCVPTRVLAHAARLLRETAQHEAYGLIGPRPEVDFARLIDSTHQVVAAVHEKKYLIKHLEDSGVETYLGGGPARFSDAHTIETAGGDRFSAERFILCLGGHARKLPFPGAELALTHSDLWNLRQLPRRLAVVGGAATGCQLASIMNTFGSKVTLLDVAPQILPIEDAAVAEALTKAFTDRGITIISGMSGVERLEKTDDGLRLVYKKDDAPHELAVDAVIVAVGWPGNVEGLGLEEVGVKTERGYITVDDALRTSVPHIFAAGDVNGRMMLVQSAGHEARIAAENAVASRDDGDVTEYCPQIVPHGGFTDPEYGSVGLTEKAARAAGRDIVVALASYINMDRAVIDRNTEGFCKLIVSRETHRILGGHVVGEQAVEIVQLISAAMAGEMSVETLATLELSYPTYVAIVGLAARRAVHYLGLMKLAPEFREMGPHYAAEWERRDPETTSTP
ncbi:MAG: NAD(P)/FAD-dependent oxidoreductase [Candidatus Promineofilum sp.]|nr:NAD(P)/FAD-dependent oxidoreductase [Promineifilum sp.]MCW5862462.1 NAD(P)/FAD-dependent oxidoreductase [Anaerolineae bacterium]